MSTPVSASELEEFTPSSLANVPVPPVFLLAPATERSERRFRFLLRKEGLRFYTIAEIREEAIKALRSLWSPEDYAAGLARLQSYWALVDQGGTPEPADTEAVARLDRELEDAWPDLCEMKAKNEEFEEMAGSIAVSMFVAGWSGIDVPYARAGGEVPLARITAVARALAEIEKEAAEKKVEGVGRVHTAFMQLCTAAYRRLITTGDEEKNFVSPPSSQPTPNGSTETSSKPTAGRRSKASASSKSKTA